MNSTATRELVSAAQLGDHNAWEVLYRRAYPRLLAFAHRRLQDPDLATEAVGETMLRAVAAIGSYTGDGDDGFTPWLFGLCRHVIADLQRGLYRRRISPTLLLQDVEPPGPAELLLPEEERVLLRAAFDRLEPDEQELLELRVVGGLSSAEAAAVLGKQPGAVRMAQARALSRLRTFMEEAARAVA